MIMLAGFLIELMHGTSGVLCLPRVSACGGKTSYLSRVDKVSGVQKKRKMDVVCCHHSRCDQFESQDSSISYVVARREHRHLRCNIKVLPLQVLK